MQPLFLDPIFKDRIWGGNALYNRFGYQIPSEKTGECWAISGHPNGQSIVKAGKYKGRTLSDLWINNRELFAEFPSPVFPLLTKILDANADLSVQVHPDDEYAKRYGELGKTECWYIIDCKENAEIILGHFANSKKEFADWVQKGQWDQLLNRIIVKPGDFFYVPAGTIHALCEGILVLETQQSSDITFRIYDYDRADQNGIKRELHLEKALEVIHMPCIKNKITPIVKKQGKNTIITFIQTREFTVYKWEICEEAKMVQDQPFQLVSLIDGTGMLTADGETYTIKKGDHFLLPSQIGVFTINGNFKAIVSHP
ncbi:mannose-6-phosphate isomerase, class I [Cytobacillus praedii]|uniref:mannose-6-phosphate isomerase, class I n=1 Tax=Cytobacillus praedii TaxID=1742358 RepID=UPI002E1DFF33|nr:mannose-6-phosphate isomerase, class I [Cytobacillus praedii]MED3552020.1 mannose-6-phosphate isomerase, class I [Cytobacillus praedii]